jgi:hypothetical protein
VIHKLTLRIEGREPVAVAGQCVCHTEGRLRIVELLDRGHEMFYRFVQLVDDKKSPLPSTLIMTNEATVVAAYCRQITYVKPTGGRVFEFNQRLTDPLTGKRMKPWWLVEIPCHVTNFVARGATPADYTSKVDPSLKSKKNAANARQKRKIKHAGDRAKIRAAYSILTTEFNYSQNCACDELAGQAQNGRARKTKLSMRYNADPNKKISRDDIRRIVTTTD